MRDESPAGEPERVRWPRLAAEPRRPLRSLLPRGYAGYTEAAAPRHIVLPASTAVPLVVKLVDSPYRPPQFIVGAHGTYSVPEGDCAPSYLEVFLAPLGAYTLLGLPMDQLSEQTVDLADVLGADGRRLAEQLREAPAWRHRFALLDEFLLRRLERGPQPAAEIGWAWQRLVTTGGLAPIRRIAGEVGWSHRHLIAKFRQQVGLRPKTAARLVRFEGVWRRLEQRKPLDWADIARDAGYADQAHLIRDFREFAGITPAELARKLPPRPGRDGQGRGEVNSVQDTAALRS